MDPRPPIATSLTDLIAVVVLPLARPGEVDLLPLVHLGVARHLEPWRPLRGARCAPPEVARGGRVVRARKAADGTFHLERRYDDVIELLTQPLPAEALLNALWALIAHGLRRAGPDIRALRVLARLEAHEDERVRAEARAAALKL
ncbi:MAG: hypothetical protein AMXMBFR64_24500 [Myxococcales bacterium]